MNKTKLLSVVAIGCLGLGLGLGHASAQTYPDREIRLVVPYPPGGGADYLGRALGDQLSKRLGQPVIVDNRGGGGTLIGTEIVAEAPADGYTLLLGSSALAINPAIYDSLPYDTENDLAPVGQVTMTPLLLVSHPDLPVESVSDLVQLAKKKPGEITFASYGNGSAAHLAGELFNLMADVDMLHVPYKGSAPALTDLLAGRVSIMFSSIAPALPHAEAGTLRALAVTSENEVDAADGVPTVADAAVPGYVATGWNAVLAPAGTPQAVIKRLNSEISAILESKEMQEELSQRGYVIRHGSPEDLGQLISSDIAKWTRVVKESGASVN